MISTPAVIVLSQEIVFYSATISKRKHKQGSMNSKCI